jgi:hypothetical protein
MKVRLHEILTVRSGCQIPKQGARVTNWMMGEGSGPHSWSERDGKQKIPLRKTQVCTPSYTALSSICSELNSLRDKGTSKVVPVHAMKA